MRRKLYEALRESHEESPRLILISTHHIEEVQTLCESLIVMHKGKLLHHQPIDEFREQGIWLAGGRSAVTSVIDGHKVLEQSAIGSKIRVMLDAPYSKQWKEQAQAYGLSIEKADLQNYLLNITEDAEVNV